MVYSIDSMHLNNGHMYPMQFMQIFGSAFCVQQLIIPERLNQIYIVGKRRFLAFQRCVIQANLSLESNLSEKVWSESILYLRLVLINQRYSCTVK